MLRYTPIHLPGGAIMGNTKSKVSITLDNDLIEVLHLRADADDRSFSQYINLILKRYMEKLLEKEQKKSGAASQ
jgi:uncharacterized protein (DUF4415 family)